MANCLAEEEIDSIEDMARTGHTDHMEAMDHMEHMEHMERIRRAEHLEQMRRMGHMGHTEHMDFAGHDSPTSPADHIGHIGHIGHIDRIDHTDHIGRGYVHTFYDSQDHSQEREVFDDELNKKFIPDYDIIDKETEIMIRKCIRQRKKKLTISESKCYEFPEILKECTFIEKIIANGCGMKRIINVPDSVEHLDLDKNFITKVVNENIPDKVNYIRLFNNELTHIDIGEKLNLTKIDLRKIDFSKVKVINLPVTIEKMDLEFALNIRTDFLKDLVNLIFIDVSNTDILDFDDIPDNVKEIAANKLNNANRIDRVITKLPKDLVEFDCKRSGIREFKFDKFPDKLVKLVLLYNNLEKLPELPNTLRKIDVEKNELTEFPLPLPISLCWIDVTGNKLSEEMINKIEVEANNLNVESKRIRGRSSSPLITQEMREARRRQRELREKVGHLCKYSYERDRSKRIVLQENVVI